MFKYLKSVYIAANVASPASSTAPGDDDNCCARLESCECKSIISMGRKNEYPGRRLVGLDVLVGLLPKKPSIR